MSKSTGNPGSSSPIDFDDTAIAFQYKSDRDLLLSYLIFILTKHPFLVKFLSQAAKLSLSMGLPVKPLIKATVFRQFCGGETRREYRKVIEQLGRANIGAILDYSVEGGGDEAGFEETKQAILGIIRQAGSEKNIPFACMKMTGIAAESLLERMGAKDDLSKEDEAARERLKKRLSDICREAGESGTPIYIDAEESWLQDAIDDLAEEMMSIFNRSGAVVFTTLQMYRTDRLAYFKYLMEKARNNGFRLGIKIVRGAYMEQERERAERRGYPSPVYPDKEATDRAFDDVLRLFMEHVHEVEICVGTHNETSCRLLAGLMADRGIPNDHPHVYFSQLYGMSDHISYNLARAGYNVTKYLPFGPVASTLPYLARRAEENKAIAGQMGKELEIIIRERQRRKSASL